MRKLLYIIVPLLLAACSSGKQAEDEQSESQLVRDAKTALAAELEKTFKVGTKAQNERVLFVNENDSICVLGFDLTVTRASGRTISGECEYVYNPEGPEKRSKPYYIDGWIIYLDSEQSIIERAKDFADRAEMDTPAERRHLASSWEQCMRLVVPLEKIDNMFPRK